MMFGRGPPSRPGSFRPDNFSQNAPVLIRNLCFPFFVLGVLIFIIVVATYQFNATFISDSTVVKTDENFMATQKTSFGKSIMASDVINILQMETDEDGLEKETLDCSGETDKPIDCTDPEVFHLMMTAAIDHFKDIHFYKFGKGVRGTNDSSCHIAWRFRPKEEKTASLYKDYRSFVISRADNCTLSVVSVGEYHSGVNAKKRKKKLGSEKASNQNDNLSDSVNDSLPIVESEKSFVQGKYLLYHGSGDRCKSMDQYLWSFLCSLGEAKYLNRTLVMDLSICLSSVYTRLGLDEEGKDFRFYFDFEHLKESASVLDQGQFWSDWNQWHQKNGLSIHLVEDIKVSPLKIAHVKDTLIMRKFGFVEPDNYWYRVCEGEAKSVIKRPWHMIRKSRRLMDIVSAMAEKLSWDFDSVHVVRGEKARNKELWPNLATDTSSEALISSLKNKIDDGRTLYIATDEPDKSFFEPLNDKYSTHFLDEYKSLWNDSSEWYSETMKLNNGVPVEFDGYMRALVDTEVFLRGKKQIETFNDLTRDCKDDINTCSSSAT